MKHTPESLAAMSDFEVNKALAWLVMMVLKKETWTFNNDKDTVQFFKEDTKKSRIVDYCNNLSDVMPLVFEHGISLVKLCESKAYAATNNPESYINDSGFRFKEVGGISFWNENPLRAAACCLILVLQEQKQ